MRPFALERFLAKHEFSVKHLACASDPDTLRVNDLLALDPGARERLTTLELGYTETRGAPALRRAIAKLYDGLSSDDVLVHTGAQEPIFTFLRSTLSAGDHVIVLTPTYQSLVSLGEDFGAQVSAWPAREADDWQPDPDELERLVRPNTKLLIVNTPQNPTGGLLTPERFEAVIRFCEQRGIALFGDEVYRGLEHGGPRLRSVAEASATGVAIGALAKVYGLSGLRIGWSVSRDRERLAAQERVKDFLSICAAGPSELLATIALEHAELLRARTMATVRRNLELVDTFIARHGGVLSWQRPRAGTTAFVRVLNEPASAFSERVLTKTGVLFAPSTLFDWPDTHVRIGLGRSSLETALAASVPALRA